MSMVVQSLLKDKRRLKNNVQLENKISSIKSEQAASAGFILGVLFCIIIVIAGKIHWEMMLPYVLSPLMFRFRTILQLQ